MKNLKKAVVYFLILLSIAILGLRFSSFISQSFDFGQKSGISVTSTPSDAKVYLNEKEVCNSTFEMKDLPPGEYIVRLEKDQATWQGSIRLNEGTITYVNRDLAKDAPSSAGEVLSLTKGKGLTIISNPNGAKVTVDGKESGATPLNVDLEKGEHNIFLEHPNYIKRSIKANLPEGFNLMVTADLAISEADLTTISTPVIKTTPEVVVKNTPTGFLRVRDKPSVSGKETTRIAPGTKAILLEELSGWVRIRLTDGVEGYVSSTYVEKASPEN